MDKNKGPPEKSSSGPQRRPDKPLRIATEGENSSASVDGAVGTQDSGTITVLTPRWVVMDQTDQSWSDTPPLPPPRPRTDGSGSSMISEKGGKVVKGKNNGPIEIGRGSMEGSGKKSVHNADGDADIASSFTESKLKKKAKLNEPPPGQPKCAICGKHFGSRKSLFGYQMSPPVRGYQGAFPPLIHKVGLGPKSTQASQPPMAFVEPKQHRVLATSLLKAAKKVSSRPTPENAEGSGSGGASSSTRGGQIGIDLNNPRRSRRGLRNDGLDLDLNAPPPETEEDEEHEKKK